MDRRSISVYSILRRTLTASSPNQGKDSEEVYLRPARPGDEAAVAQAHVRAWQQGYRGLLPDDYLDRLDPLARASRYTFGDDGPDRPHTTVVVDGDSMWMLVGNQRAERFYRIDGWKPDGQRRLQEVHGIDVDEVRYHRSLE